MNPLEKYKHAIEVAKKKPKGMMLSYKNVLAEVADYAAQLEAENKQLREFERLVQVEWTTLESAESEGVVRVEYPADVHKRLKALGGE